MENDKNGWLFHKCDSEGCYSRVLITDICEKIHRSKCAAPSYLTKCNFFNAEEINYLFSHCPNSPHFTEKLNSYYYFIVEQI